MMYLFNMKEENQLHKIMQNGFKIYPEIKGYKFGVCIEDSRNVVYQKKKTVGEYKHTTKTINKAIISAIDYIYKKITHL